MRIGPGGGGSSTGERVSVSKSRIDSPQRLLLRQRLEQRRELGAAVAAGQGQPQRLQVSPDRLQLPDELAGSVVVQTVRGPPTKLLEALQRRTRLLRQPRRLRLEHLLGESARLIQVAGAAE